MRRPATKPANTADATIATNIRVSIGPEPGPTLLRGFFMLMAFVRASNLLLGLESKQKAAHRPS